MKRWKYKNYKEYLESQLQHQRTMYRTQNRKLNRLEDIGIVKKHLVAKKILCVGARDVSEINDWREANFVTTGIDLFTTSPTEIEVLDAHDMSDRFGENEFDVIYASHSLEHMYDPEVVLRAVRKIGKFGAMIVLPLEDIPTAKDPTIFKFIEEGKTDSESIQQSFVKFMGNDIKCEFVKIRPVTVRSYQWTDFNKEDPFEVSFLLTW